MKDFIVYDDTGKILRSGKCHEAVFAAQARKGEFVIEGVADDAECYVCTKMQVVKKRQQPLHFNKVALRSARNRLLANSDWTQLPDVPLSRKCKRAFEEYRQDLRDLPQIYGVDADIDEVSFPTPPEFEFKKKKKDKDDD